MEKRWNFEQNTLQKLELQVDHEGDFEKMMQIEGLSADRQTSTEPFPSVKTLFGGGRVSAFGSGSNANIRSFAYLLLTHLRSEHLRQCLVTLKEQEQKQDEELGRRDRRVSFNNKGVLFLSGPQYENYTLHKLRIFAFSSGTDLSLIEGQPLNWQDKPLTSTMMKKLLSQFLRAMLPQAIDHDYRQTLKSVQHYLKIYPSADVLLIVLMRYILYSKYGVEDALNYEVQLNDHTVCTTLCDAFAVDGLICKNNVFQISSWCRICIIQVKLRHYEDKRREYFVELRGNEFEEIGLSNDAKEAVENKNVSEKQDSSYVNIKIEEEENENSRQDNAEFVPYISQLPGQNQVLYNTAGFASFGLSDSEAQSPQTPGPAQTLAGSKEAVEEENESVMSADEDSQMPSSQSRVRSNSQDTSRKESLLVEEKHTQSILEHSFRKNSEVVAAVEQLQSPDSLYIPLPETSIVIPITNQQPSPSLSGATSSSIISQLSIPSSPPRRLPSIRVTKLS